MALVAGLIEHPAAESTVSISESGKRIHLDSGKHKSKRQKSSSTDSERLLLQVLPLVNSQGKTGSTDLDLYQTTSVCLGWNVTAQQPRAQDPGLVTAKMKKQARIVHQLCLGSCSVLIRAALKLHERSGVVAVALALQSLTVDAGSWAQTALYPPPHPSNEVHSIVKLAASFILPSQVASEPNINDQSIATEFDLLAGVCEQPENESRPRFGTGNG